MGNPFKPSTKIKQNHPLHPIEQHTNSHAAGAFFRKLMPVMKLQSHREHALGHHSEEKTVMSRIQRGCFGCLCCCSCMCTLICLLILTLVAVGCIFYFGFPPKAPTYTLSNLSISGFEPLLLSPNTPISPSIIATIQTKNPNEWISILYQTGGVLSVSFSRVNLCEGDWPVFCHKPKNLTVFQTNLTGSGVLLSALNRDELVKDQLNGNVPLMVNVEVPVTIKFSFVESPLIAVNVFCNVSVSVFTANASILSKNCDVKTHYLW